MISKKLIILVIFIISSIGITEIGATVWEKNLNTCIFENNENYSHLDEKAIKVLCDKNLNLNFMSDVISTTSDESNHINSEGFRGTEFSSEKPTNTFRIIIVGGSTVFGNGVLDDHTMPAHLQKIFDDKKLDFKIEVINAGTGGSWSKTEIKMIKQKIVNYNPDLIIVYGGINDAHEELREIPDKEVGPDFWKNRLIGICNYGVKEKFETVIILQPILGSSEKMKSDQEYTDHVFNNITLKKIDNLESYAIHIEEIKQHCAEAIDFREIFNNVQESIYYDPYHVGSKGNQIIAEKVYNTIIPIINQNNISDLDFTMIQNPKKLDSEIENNDIDEKFNYKTPQMISYFLGYQNEFSNNEQNNLDLKFSGKIIRGDNFSGQDLKNSIFRYSSLSNINFEDTELQNTDFSFATLTNINFKNSNLENVDFRFTAMDNIKFIDSNIKNIQFGRTTIKNTDLSNMDFRNQHMTGNYFVSTDFTDSNFENAKLVGTIFNSPSFTRTNFANADLSMTLFLSADFTTAKIKESNFENARIFLSDFSGVDFTNVNFVAPSLAGSLLKNVNLQNTDLGGFDFSGKIIAGQSIKGAIIDGVDLSNKDLTKTAFHTSGKDLEMDLQKLWGVEIRNSDLSGVDLSNVVLRGMKFLNVDLSNADLSNADLRGANLENVNLSGTNFNNADLRGANLEIIDFMNADLTNVIIDSTTIMNSTEFNCIGHEICEGN